MLFTTAEEYIDAQAPEVQLRLRELQAIVREVLPEAPGVISYGMPTYRFPGGALYFGRLIDEHAEGIAR